MENLELETLLLAYTSSISFTVVFGILFAIGLFAFSLLPINKYVMPWRQYIKRAFIKRDILIEYEEKNLLRWGSVEGSVFLWHLLFVYIYCFILLVFYTYYPISYVANLYSRLCSFITLDAVDSRLDKGG